jgi:hypothetical protein
MKYHKHCALLYVQIECLVQRELALGLPAGKCFGLAARKVFLICDL